MHANATAAARCDICGIPADAETFDASGFVGRPASESEEGGEPLEPFAGFLEPAYEARCLPRRGEQTVLASFQLHPQYCGVLTSFAQFTDLYARDNTQILTPGFEWLIFQNGKPVFPYTPLAMIVNPWGYNCFTFVIRLDENARVEMAIRNRGVRDEDLADYPQRDSSTDRPIYPIRAFAGRLIGRYWYNRTFGDAARHARAV